MVVALFAAGAFVCFSAAFAFWEQYKANKFVERLDRMLGDK